MPYSFVWLYLIKCVFTCSIFVDSNTKRLLSVLVVFGKYFVLTKTENFKKHCCPILATQSRVRQVACHNRELAVSFGDLFVSGRSSREGYTKIFVAQLMTPSWVRLPVAKNTQQIFSKLLAWSVLAGDIGDFLATYLSREKHVFCTVRAVFKTFFSFPLNFLWLFTFSVNWNYPNTPCHSLQTPFLLHFFSNLQEKGMDLLFLTSHFMFWVLFSCFMSCHCDLRYTVFENVFT